ncbi:molecular chaperone [Pluralibacter gergoviae]
MTSRFLRPALLCAGLLPAGAMAAASILIWPVDPTLPAGKNATELWLENRGDTPAVMQVRVVGWQQENGFERYRPQQDVVASPPMISLSAGGKQLIRLIKQSPVPAGQERAWRIVIDEIPPAAGTGGGPSGLKLQMRYSIPLFAYGEGLVPAQGGDGAPGVDPAGLSWRVAQVDGGPALQVQNRGRVHLRLSQVSLSSGGAPREMAQGLLGYVLPGQTRSWPLPAGMNHPTRLSATINAKPAIWQSPVQN